MASVNKAILVGNLGRDPELKYTQSGQAVCNFTLATNEKWKDKDGQAQERTEWHRVVLWGRQAETAAQYLSKGRPLYLEGRIQTREWEDKDGNKRYTTEIVGTNFQFLGSGRGQDGGGPSGPPSGGGATGGSGPMDSGPPPADDIPF